MLHVHFPESTSSYYTCIIKMKSVTKADPWSALHAAAAYCNWLSDLDGLPRFYRIDGDKVSGFNPAATGYRLPTEAEWAWAARQTGAEEAELRFPWGRNLPPPDRHGNYADRSASHLVGRVIFGYNDNHIVAAPVGTFDANRLGLFDLSGKVTVVTGGNSGLGLAFARGIAKQGGDVSIWARNAEKNAAAQAELEAFGVRVSTQQVDVSDEAQIVAGFEAGLKAHGRIDCVIAKPTTRDTLVHAVRRVLDGHGC
jgi:hypothetical protein